MALILTLLYTVVLELPRWNPPPGMEDGYFTGALSYDTPTYYANAREIFDGDGWFLYANPYDLSEDPHAIYFHTFTLIKGYTWRVLGIGIENQEWIWRCLLGFVFLLLLDGVCGIVLNLPKGSQFRVFAHVLVCTGGGVVALWTVAQAWWTWATLPVEQAATTSFMDIWMILSTQLEDGAQFGKWLMSPARVFLFTNELFYHCLFASFVIAHLTTRHLLASAMFALSWMSHPFTAAELTAIVFPALAVEIYCRPEDRRTLLKYLSGLIAITVLGLAYYQLYLPSFETHREVVSNFSLPVSVAISTTAVYNLWFIYGLVLIGAVAWLVSGPGRQSLKANSIVRFLLIQSAVVAVLIQHDKIPFVSVPLQPLHFGRGYLWLSLALLSLLGIQALYDKYLTEISVYKTWGVLVGIILILALDTMHFYAAHPRIGPRRFEGVPWISRDTWAVFEKLSDLEPGIVFTIEESPMSGVGYLIPTWTHHRTYLAHGCNTPFLMDRLVGYGQQLEQASTFPDQFDAVVMNKLFVPHWESLYTGSLRYYENDEWIVLTKYADVIDSP